MPEVANLGQDPEVVKVRRKVVVEGDYLECRLPLDDSCLSVVVLAEEEPMDE